MDLKNYSASRDSREFGSAHDSRLNPAGPAILTPMLLGMVVCFHLGWAPLLLLPSAIGCRAAFKRGDVPLIVLTGGILALTVLYVLFRVTVVRSPFL